MENLKKTEIIYQNRTLNVITVDILKWSGVKLTELDLLRHFTRVNTICCAVGILVGLIIVEVGGTYIPYYTQTTMYGLEECIPRGADVTHYTTANCGIECDYYLTHNRICFHKWVPLY